MPLRAVLFDWADTLIAYPGATTDPEGHAACLASLWRTLPRVGLCPCLGTRVGEAEFRAAYERVTAAQVARSRRTLREHRFEARLARTLARAGCTCPPDPRRAIHAAALFAGILAAHSRPVPGARDVLETVGRSRRLGLVSNHPYPPVVWDTLRRAGLLDRLEAVVVSGSLGWIKPEPRIFRAALDALGVRPHEAAFIGDDPPSDIAGARALGLRTALLRTPRTEGMPCAADIVLDRLADAPSWLDGLDAGMAHVRIA